jgi:hypothetical protein
MAYAREGWFRGIIWLVLVVFYVQTLNPAMLGYAPWQGSPPTRTEAMTGSFWQGMLDFVMPAAQAAMPAKPAQTSVVFAQRTYVPAYAQPQANGDPLLASTPEFDLNDPYLVAKANELGKDPQRIFAFVRDSIGFESYVGSLRGARGTLWSNAGNALDQASLLIALLRISGIPARYAQGTLAKDKAQELIASMFLPAPYRVVGFVPDDAEKSDPVNDPALIAEASQHFWVELGGGFVAADPAFRSAELGQTFTAASGQFAEVPDNLRHKVAVRLQAETGGNVLSAGLDKKVVLDYTFSSAELVGKPLSLGHFVNSTPGAVLIHTYSPYLLVGQNDGNISDDPIIRGQDYQEFISGLFGALVNQVVTGVFLEMDVIQPGGQKETFERALVDRVGFAARNSGTPNIDISFDQPSIPAINISNLFTFKVDVGWSVGFNSQQLTSNFENTQIELIQLQRLVQDADINNLTPYQQDILSQINLKYGTFLALYHSLNLNGYSSFSDEFTQQIASGSLVKVYLDSGRIIFTSTILDTHKNILQNKIDLVKNDIKKGSSRVLVESKTECII